jgi:serine protease AprX
VGVAPEADIMGVGIDETLTPQQSVDATGTQLSMLGAIAGFNYILLHGLGDTPDSMTVKVVLAGWIQSGLYDPWHPMALALLDLASFGITVVFPAGNNGPDASNCSEAATCHMNAWAPSTVAITVAATPKTSRTVLEPYSSRGDPAWRTFHDETFRYAPSISAPGTRVMSARRIGLASVAQPPAYSMTGASGDGISLDRRYVALTGTSVAAAHVAGAIALMQQAAFQAGGCYLTPQQVKSILQSTATAMPGTSPVDVGAGMVDITHAVMASRGAC